jgi:hypothetical protein
VSTSIHPYENTLLFLDLLLPVMSCVESRSPFRISKLSPELFVITLLTNRSSVLKTSVSMSPSKSGSSSERKGKSFR